MHIHVHMSDHLFLLQSAQHKTMHVGKVFSKQHRRRSEIPGRDSNPRSSDLTTLPRRSQGFTYLDSQLHHGYTMKRALIAEMIKLKMTI
jgi:hypothetical protein